MRIIIFLLLVLLTACAPASTAVPTLTPIPPTATATPSPTETPTPTTTPEKFQTSLDGHVQVYENGKYIDLTAPEGIQGPVDGTKVVLVEDEEGNQEAYTQMELNDFQTPDGAYAVNVAKYNEKTKGWDLLPFSFTRSGFEYINFNPLNYSLYRYDMGPRIDVFYMYPNVLGLKSDDGSLEIMILFKGVVKVIDLDQINIYEVILNYADPTLGSSKMEVITPEDMNVQDAVEIINGLNNSSMLGRKSTVSSKLEFIVVPVGTTEEDCDGLGGYYNESKLNPWCKSQVAMGKDRKVPTRGEVNWALTNPQTVVINEDSEFPDLNSLWKDAAVFEIEGAFVKLEFQKQTRR